MWRVVLVTLIVLVLLALMVLVSFLTGVKTAEREARSEDRAGLAGAVFLRRAMSLLNDMISPTDLDQFSTLNAVHRERAVRLLADYNTKFRKGSQ
jgi:type II secretory pathway pseudopilin PulG